MILLFAYGTLQQANVQLATFGRLLEGEPDALAGYKLTSLAITDTYVAQTSGLAVHTAAEWTGNPADLVPGTAYAMTAAELMGADQYEVTEMTRVLVTLQSGRQAFVYVMKDAQP